MSLRSLYIFLVVFLLAGCGSSRPQQEVAASPVLQGSTDARHEARPSAPAESEARYKSADSGAPSPNGMAPPAAYRPGLATSWGEARHSQVHSALFERQSALEPTEWARVQYDDESGVRAASGGSYFQVGPHEQLLLGGALRVSLVDDDDDALPSVRVGASSYVIAERGERYQIQIDNRSGARFEIVASVDGLDVLDGRPGGFEKRGYLVAPYSTLIIEGFRVSDSEVAAFRFGSVEQSYAAARGGAQNVGVVGIAAFAERYSSWGSPDEVYRRQNANPFPGRYATPPGY